MLHKKYKLRVTSTIALCIFLVSYYPIRAFGQNSPPQNPHALNLQQRYTNELEVNSGKGKSESNLLDGEMWQAAALLNGREILDHQNLKEPASFDYLSSRFPIIDQYRLGQGQNGEKEREKLLQRFLWDTKYSFPLLSRVLNHPNGWRIKSEEFANARSPLDYEQERRGDNINPLGDLRNTNEPKGAMSSDPYNIINPDMTQKRNNNPGFICHFKLCQLGASGKRRFTPSANRDF